MVTLSTLRTRVASVHIPPPVIVGFLGEIGVIASRLRGKQKSTKLQKPLTKIGKFIEACGVLLSIWAALTMLAGRQNPNPRANKTKVISGGPFKYTRNPIYLGAILSATGRSISKRSLIGVVLSLVGGAYIDQVVVPKEEQYLESVLGEDYAPYKDRTPRWILSSTRGSLRLGRTSKSDRKQVQDAIDS